MVRTNHMQQYKKYWNEWHNKWHHSLTNPSTSSILGWSIPKTNGGNDRPINEYFPEPFWGDIDNENLKAVFLNINPGKGGDKQNFVINQTSELRTLYSKNCYSKTVSKLCEDKDYVTTMWMNKKRVAWLQNLLDDREIDICDTLHGDLIPWHTKSKSYINKYINNTQNHKLVIQKVILPIAGIAKTIKGGLNNIVIVRAAPS